MSNASREMKEPRKGVSQEKGEGYEERASFEERRIMYRGDRPGKGEP